MNPDQTAPVLCLCCSFVCNKAVDIYKQVLNLYLKACNGSVVAKW